MRPEGVSHTTAQSQENTRTLREAQLQSQLPKPRAGRGFEREEREHFWVTCT